MNKPELMPLVEALKQQVDEHGFIDVGEAVEKDLPVSRTELNVALTILKEDGYQVHFLKTLKMATREEARLRVLVGPDVTRTDTWNNRENIRLADFTQQ